MTATVNIRRTLTDQELAYIAITAVEQGIGYWAGVRGYDGDRMYRIATGEAPEAAPFGESAVLFEVTEEPHIEPVGWRPVTPRVVASGIERVLSGVREKGFVSLAERQRRDPGAYHCPDCGWSRVILAHESLDEAKANHEQTYVHEMGAWQFQPRAFSDMEDLGAMDADEADWVVQLGLLGELRYG